MKFGRIATVDAAGAILAHGVKGRDYDFKKGHVVAAGDISALLAADIHDVVVARLGAEDVEENVAARALAVALAGRGVRPQQAFTGRANLYAETHGLVVIDQQRVQAINHLHESLTLATIAPHSVVAPRQMLATVKVIPFATPRAVLDRALAIAGDEPLFRVRPFQRKQISLIVTTLAVGKASLVKKSEAAMRDRLQKFGLDLKTIEVVVHHETEVCAAITELKQRGSDCILLFGASAIVDREDVLPAALVAAGGTVLHLGMPVDPGNLLMLGALGDTPVIGVPTCARSSKRNGFDWVLERVLAGIAVTSRDIMDMGVGGLLAEIPSRPLPREFTVPAVAKVTALVLAAGQSQRMGFHKMLMDFHGQPLLRVTVQQLLGAGVEDVVVVTGHERDACVEALNGLPVRFVHNPDFAEGLATSIKAGVAAAGNADAVLVCLGDMPRVKPTTIESMIAAFNPKEQRSIVVPVHKYQIGNPVLWGRDHFSQLLNLTGDKGARSLIDAMRAEITEIVTDDVGVLQDADTPEALAELLAVRN